MQNNQVKIIVDDGPEVIFRFSHIIGLTYNENGFRAVVDLDGQKVNIPVSSMCFKDAVVYISENVKHCKECQHRLKKSDLFCGDVLVQTQWLCPKCDGHEN